MAGGIDERIERMEMLKAFDETEAGVKGLVDSGLHKIPDIFVRPAEELAQESTYKKTQIQVPVIDLTDIHDAGGRNRIVEQVRSASESWGFFQVVYHGIPLAVLDGMIDGVREFHEQDLDEKKYYSRDSTRRVRFNSSHDLFTSRTASWRDSLIVLLTNSFHEDELPPSCRNSIAEYAKHVKKLGNSMLGLLSEALGLKPDHLENMECASGGQRLLYHYYPACPNPELAIGITKHSDAGVITILLQSQMITSCLQVLYQGQWVDIPPTPGGLVINVGNLLQLVSNGKFISNVHRVLASQVGPRISAACFFSGPLDKANKIYGPIKELISDENPSIYRDVVLGDYFAKFFTTGMDSYRALDYYKIN